jgi:hypothetical protein
MHKPVVIGRSCLIEDWCRTTHPGIELLGSLQRKSPINLGIELLEVVAFCAPSLEVFFGDRLPSRKLVVRVLFLTF